MQRFNTIRGQLAKGLTGGSFRANVLILAGSTGLGQGLYLLIFPLLTRLYTPADFGILSIYTFLFSALAAINSLRYEFAIPLPDTDADGAALVVLIGGLVIGSTLLFGAILWLFGSAIVVRLNAPTLAPYLWLLPLSLLLSGFYQAFSYWAIRKKKLAAMARSGLLQNISQIVIYIGARLLIMGPLGLLIGQVFGQAVGMLTLLRRTHLSAPALNRLPTLARTYRNFPLFTTWSSLIDIIGGQLPPVVLAYFFGLDSAGFFATAIRLLGLPATLIGAAVSQTSYAVLVEKKDDPRALRQFAEPLAMGLFILAFTVFAFITLHADTLFGIFFGANWRGSGRFVQIMAFSYGASFIASPLSLLALIYHRQQEVFWISVAMTIFRIGGLWIGAQSGVADAAIGLFAIGGVAINLIYLAWVLHLVGSSLHVWLGSVRGFAITDMLLFGALFISRGWLSPLLTMFVSALSLGAFNGWFWLRYHAQRAHS